VKVRAPKLSKEFKPTRVYEILNDSLQTLTDEDLRAMVDAMEKMDEIQDSLEILKRAFDDVKIIRNEYIRYNQYMLAKKAQAYIEIKQRIETEQSRLNMQEQNRIKIEEEQKINTERLFDLEEQKKLKNVEKAGLLDTNLEEIDSKLKKAKEDNEEAFIKQQERVLLYARDLMEKEEFILYPTSMALISEEEFESMKSGDQEIGFAFFNVEQKPTENKPETSTKEQGGFANELQTLLSKYGYADKGNNNLLDVTTGKLTLEQINLIYKHLPVDISFVDENELVCFYSDTNHRIFPRSRNVIGREVMNCHPRKSAHIVREVIDKLRSGEQDKAEFWINKPNLFIYIIYIAVRDKDGKFRGVLEMMQDCTHIRAMKGSQTLLTWSDQKKPSAQEEPIQETASDHEDASEEKSPAPITDITPQTRLKDLLKQYPALKGRLPEIDPKFKMLNSPLGKLMLGKVNIQMMSERSGVPLDKLIESIKKLIK